MMSITLILGGARSGKSSYAEASSKQQLKQDLKINSNMTLKRVPYYNVKGKTLWGATAMMLNEIKMLFK